MNHEEILEAVPLLAIDALPEEEQREVRKHLEGCASCRALLTEYEGVAASLLAGVPAVTPPDSVAAGLRRRLPATQRARVSSRAPGLRQRLWSLPRWTLAGAGVALLVLLAAGVWIFAIPRGQSPEAEIASLSQTPGTINISIKGTDRAPKSWGRVVANPDSSSGFLVVGDFASLPPQQIYQVWMMRDGERDSCGLFTVDDKGRATVRIQAPESIREYTELGVSVEPAGGSKWPTTPHVIDGALAQK